MDAEKVALEEFNGDLVTELSEAQKLVDSLTIENDALREELEAVREELSLAKHRLERYDAASERARERLCKLANLKQETANAKKAYDGAMIELAELSEEDDYPLFDKKTKPAAEKQAEPKPVEPQPNDAWKEVSVTALGLNDRTTQLLLEAKPNGITTLGEFQQFLAKKTLRDIDGVGEAKAQLIEDAWMKFWQDHPEYTVPVTVVPDPTPEEQAELGVVASEAIEAESEADWTQDVDDPLGDVDDVEDYDDEEESE